MSEWGGTRQYQSLAGERTAAGARLEVRVRADLASAVVGQRVAVVANELRKEYWVSSSSYDDLVWLAPPEAAGPKVLRWPLGSWPPVGVQEGKCRLGHQHAGRSALASIR